MIRTSKLVWVASFPKSGNTWMRIFLSNYIKATEKPISINNLSSSSTIHANNRVAFDRFVGVLSSDLLSREINYYRPYMYKAWSLESDKLLFIKVHEAWRKNTFGEAIYPSEATYCVLYIIRNPFDIVPSYANHYNVSIDKAIQDINNDYLSLSTSLNKLTKQLPAQLLTNWSENIRSWVDISGLDVCVVRYEDMVCEPFQTFGKIISKLGFPKDDSRLRKAIDFSSFDILKKQELEEGFKERLGLTKGNFFNKGNIGTWRTILTDKQTYKIIEKHKEMLYRFGYVDNSNTPTF